MNKLEQNNFKNIIAFMFSEIGSMGPRDITFYAEEGKSFSVDYLSEETSYSKLKELFPVLKECYWNGPMKHEMAAGVTVVIGGIADDKETRVAQGWRHIYLDVGNHLAVREEYYRAFQEIFSGKDNCDITFSWTDMLDEANFVERASEVAGAYYEQKRQDEALAKVLLELKQNPEYMRRMSEVSKERDLDKMMDVFEEFSGIKMSWFELKQFKLRQLGLL